MTNNGGRSAPAVAPAVFRAAASGGYDLVPAWSRGGGLDGKRGRDGGGA